MISSCPGGSALRCPGRSQIFAHVECPVHLAACHLACERKGERISELFALHAPDADLISIDRSREIARDKVSLMHSAQIVRLLADLKCMRRESCRVVDAHIPATGEIGDR